MVGKKGTMNIFPIIPYYRPYFLRGGWHCWGSLKSRCKRCGGAAISKATKPWWKDQAQPVGSCPSWRKQHGWIVMVWLIGLIDLIDGCMDGCMNGVDGLIGFRWLLGLVHRSIDGLVGWLLDWFYRFVCLFLRWWWWWWWWRLWWLWLWPWPIGVLWVLWKIIAWERPGIDICHQHPIQTCIDFHRFFKRVKPDPLKNAGRMVFGHTWMDSIVLSLL